MTSTYRRSNNFSKRFDTNFIQLGNYNVHYLKREKGEPVMLIHGGGTWMYSWRNVIDSLAKKYTVYACDMPGQGYTTAIKEPKYDLDDFAQFIDMFIDHFQLDKITLIGNSWGGGWALYFAEEFSEKVKNLILIDPSGLSIKDTFEWEILKYPVIGELVSRMITKTAVYYSYKKAYVDHDLIDKELIEQTYRPLKLRKTRRALYKIKRHCDWSITEQRMNDINVPTKIIWGEKDNYLNVKYAKLYASKIKNSDLTIIYNSGHTPQEEKPSETVQIIDDFLSK